MAEPLQDRLSSLQKDSDLLVSGEDDIRAYIIRPILARLGWNTESRHEVAREFRVKNGRVDYCLRIGDKNLVFIEAKGGKENLGQNNYQEQLVRYAFDAGVPIAILTNGRQWWFYLPLLEGMEWDKRKFLVIDISEQEPEKAAQHFREFLSRDAIANGSAADRARSVHASKEKARLVALTIPKAWNELCGEPDAKLLNLLAEKIESMCGHRAEFKLLTEFLVKLPTSTSYAASAQQPILVSPQGPTRMRDRQPASYQGSGNYTFTKPCAFTFMGRHYSASNWKDVLVGICAALYQAYPTDFLSRVKELRGRTKPYFSHNPNEVRDPREIPGTGLYVGTCLSAPNIMERCYRIMEAFGCPPNQLDVEKKV